MIFDLDLQFAMKGSLPSIANLKSQIENPMHALNAKIVKCDLCPRLRTYCQTVAAEKRRAFASWDYWGKPVPNFGDASARLLIVGLAPAAHGANRTGRMFTGDRSGEWLYRSLHKAGFANQPHSTHAADGLQLHDCAITAVCHCAPPDNKPTPQEMRNCRSHLSATFDLLNARVFVALGQIAWNAAASELIARCWLTTKRPKFAHQAEVALVGERWLLGSYHPSQQTTFTGRLTEPMLDAVFRRAAELINNG